MQKVLSSRFAQASQGEGLKAHVARMALAVLPRGGGEGDAIRMTILDLLRSNGIKEGHRPGIECRFLAQVPSLSLSRCSFLRTSLLVLCATCCDPLESHACRVTGLEKFQVRVCTSVLCATRTASKLREFEMQHAMAELRAMFYASKWACVMYSGTRSCTQTRQWTTSLSERHTSTSCTAPATGETSGGSSGSITSSPQKTWPP
jgi:hypothetical protein